MWNHLHTAYVILSVGRDGEVVVVKNSFGGQTKAGAIRAFVNSLSSEDRELFLRTLDAEEEFAI